MVTAKTSSIFCLVVVLTGYAFLDAQSRQASTATPKAAVRVAAAKPKPPAAGASVEEFARVVKPLLTGTCGACHNEQLASGGLDMAVLQDASSLSSNRDEWDLIAKRLDAGEMPPAGIPKDTAQIGRVVSFLKDAFARADAGLKADPGRIAVHRLNRVEYSNTVRDLLGVSYRADREFPRDDEGEGFDNNADLLTMSPVLAEKYMSAAGQIAAKAMATEHLPKPSQFAYTANQDPELSRRWPVFIQERDNTPIYDAELINNYGDLAYLIDPSTLEFKHRIEYASDYAIHVELAGSRGADSPPVNVGLMMDGELLYQAPIAFAGGRGGGYTGGYRSYDVQRALPAGDHVFRVVIMNDDFVKTKGLSEKDSYNTSKNAIPYGVKILGPLSPKADTSIRNKILVCPPATGATCVDRILSGLARRAYRRPVTKREVAGLMQIVTSTQARGRSAEEGIQNAIRAILVSPDFLFRIERDPNPLDTSKAHPVSEVELASRLSYFLWSSMPDDELLGLAESGRLRAPGVLEAQVKRMLTDRKAMALADNFAGQWLQLRNLDELRFDTDKFPDWEPAIKEAMATETKMFFNYVLKENRPVTDFLDGRYTFLNGPLAKYYGIADISGPEFRKVDLKSEQRGGVLTQGSVLAISSYPTRTSVVLRGKFVLDNIFNSPPPPPPPNVPRLNEETVGELSLRQQMEKHRADPACASCHNRMDPIGFALENFNAVGEWRTMDGKDPVDPSGTLAGGKSFTNVAEFRAALLAKTPEFTQALTEKMLIYSLGRALTRSDRNTVSSIQSQLAASGNQAQNLILAIVRSLPFDSRRGYDSPAVTQVAKTDGAQR